MIDEGFTQKEMLLRILDKFEKMDDKLAKTHELAKTTNGKVKLHTKLICALFGIIISVGGWFISYILN